MLSAAAKLGRGYGACSTAAATKAKAVPLSGFTLVTGAIVGVKFSYDNTATAPTLNVNSTGAKSIYYKGEAAAAGLLKVGYVYLFQYNGAQYELLNPGHAEWRRLLSRDRRNCPHGLHGDRHGR